MKSPIIRAENTIDAPRLREYVRFIFKIKYGFLGNLFNSLAFLLALISLAALYTKEWLIFLYFIVAIAVFVLFSITVKSIMFARAKKKLSDFYLNNISYAFDNEKMIVKSADREIIVSYKDFINVYESRFSLYISYKQYLSDGKFIRLFIMIGKNNIVGDCDFLDLRNLLIKIMGKRYKDKNKVRI